MNEGSNPPIVRFPGSAQDPSGQDLSMPVVKMLEGLSILGTPDEMKNASGVTAAFGGPPQSVAIIESGATALGKWWTVALGAGATVTGIVAGAQAIWGGEHDLVRVAF